MDGLIEIATLPETDILVTAIVGMIGILPTIEAIKAGKDIALANKETLVTAGHIIMPLAERDGRSDPSGGQRAQRHFPVPFTGKTGARLRRFLSQPPVDPSGERNREELEHVQVEDALKHPNWSMGQKITIDSATLVNKGLEVMEAQMAFRRGSGPIFRWWSSLRVSSIPWWNLRTEQ